MMASYSVGTVKTHRKPSLEWLHCSFCGAPENKVEWLVAAPPLNKWAASYICDECVEAAVSTLKEARRIERAQRYR